MRGWRSPLPVRSSASPNEDVVVETARAGDDPDLSLWVERLKDRDSHKRMHAATILAALGPRARAALPMLIEALKDPAPEVRRMAAVGLGEIGTEARVAVPALIQALQDEDECVRRRAIVALGDM